jgi:hypothetical protein
MIKIGEFPLKFINTIKKFKNFKRKKMTLKIGEEKDWKFGLITRTCYRASEDRYSIHDFSDGWLIAEVNQETFDKLETGEIGLETLNWE